MIGQKNTHHWIQAFRSRSRDLISRLESIYGSNESLIEERLGALLETAMRFSEAFGEEGRQLSSGRREG